MSSTTLPHDTVTSQVPERPFPFFSVALIVSLFLHGAGLLWASLQEKSVRTIDKPIEIEMVDIPPAPKPEKIEAPKEEKRPPIRVAKPTGCCASADSSP